MHASAGLCLPARGRTGFRAAETPKHQRPLSTGQPLWIRGGMSSASLEVLQIDKYDRHNVDSSRKAARSPAAHVARSTQIGATALISRSAAPRCRILFHLQLQHVIGRISRIHVSTFTGSSRPWPVPHTLSYVGGDVFTFGFAGLWRFGGSEPNR